MIGDVYYSFPTMKKEQNKEARVISCPPEVLALVERFAQNLDSYCSGRSS
jgi:hypothetical protein